MVPIEEADFSPDSFDFIAMGAVLEHLYDPSEAIGKVLSWLKPAGVAFIEVPSSDHLISKVINFLYKLTGNNFVTNLSPMHPPFHIYEFSLDTFKIHGKKFGYDVSYHEHYISRIYHLPKILHPILRLIMRKTDTGMLVAIWIRKIDPQHRFRDTTNPPPGRAR